MDRRCRARQIEDLVDLDKKRMGDVVAQQLEALMIEEVLNVVPRSSEEIVDAQHLAAKLQKSLAEMRTEKSCSTGNENSSFEMLHCRPVV